MPLELRLIFPDSARAAVQLLDDSLEESGFFPFAKPLEDKDLEEIRWYLEDYGTRYAAEPDDERADKMREQLRAWGAKLFEAVFKANDTAFGYFLRFLQAKKQGRLLTVAASHPAVLSLPWELLRPPGESFLFAENPRIAIRRGLPAIGLGREPYRPKAKAVLRVLFIVSRPEGASFINPRTDPQAVLNALDMQEQQRAEVEFLRPATLTALEKRLRADDLPAVDIIHFDGHGAFDRSSSLAKREDKAALPPYMQGLLREAEERGETAPAGGQGYLLFENESGGKFYAEARILGELLFRQQVGLVVLSACKSAEMGEDDAMSGVAARLVHAGIPAVLAMTHSVLVKTTEALFAEFYRSLFKGSATGAALDDARAALRRNQNRGKRLRGTDGCEEVTLELEDWFLPALYQNGADKPLLKKQKKEASLPPKPEPLHNLPKQRESGFFGRSRELWQIERAFAVEKCRRYSITGFGGQGKTALALEAGRWLLRTKLFKRACFVSYAAYQGSDPVSMAVSTMSAALQESLVDAAAAEAALKRVPTLLILDNLESLADGRGLHELLDAAALWSEAGASRVLLTSRQPDFHHPAYPLGGSFDHRHLPLQGLREDDAVKWFDALRSLPPEPTSPRPQRDVLIRLFEQVGFHPLSISLLAQQLKERGPADVGERLEALLALQPVNQADRSLLASLELSIERLPERCREWLPRLGVFAGGCLEQGVMMVTGIKEADWQELRSHLLRAGLMQDERLPVADMTFLRFHPTLAPALWQKLGKEEQARLTEGYWQAYYGLSLMLYKLDSTTPHAARAIAQHELPNLLRAVHAALQTGRNEEGVDFADKVNRFLHVFGMRRDYQELTEAAAKAGGAVGSQAWFLSRSNVGEQLWQSGQPASAAQVFADILAGLEETPSYNRCLTLSRLGRCFNSQGQPAEAEQLYRQELAELSCLKQDEQVRRQTSSVWIDLADVLCDQGRYTEAKTAYQAGLEIKREIDDVRGRAVVTGQLGTLAQRQGQLTEAVERYKEALYLFQRINEPESEAMFWHQLGIVYQRSEDYKEAEQAYRQAARLWDDQGLLGGMNGAGASWNQLAQVCMFTGREAEAEQWYRKALMVRRDADDRPGIAITLSNLAILLANQPARLDETRHLAKEGVDISETLDPAAAEIWKNYELLAQITSQQGESSQAAAYRAKSRQAYLAFPGWRQQLYQYEALIAVVVQASTDQDLRNKLEPALDDLAGREQANFVAAIRSLLSGERDEAALCGPLDYEEAAVIRAILEGIAGKG
ncbi:MAG: tetratricopeptide repeat protein [Candidatus Electronema sp. V4]|uniref:tetratricopeptide repeat protein n=1 Tax=Candidatus Electronema sp. V4 TaxID=3454756 RepID=UPI0040555821